MDVKGALERALLAVNGDDQTARNDARVLLAMATAFRHGISIDFEGLAVAETGNRGDALAHFAGLFDLNAHLMALRRETDWQSIELIDTYAIEQSRTRRQVAQSGPTTELWRLINDGAFDEADERHARLTEEGDRDPVALDDARTAIDSRLWESTCGFAEAPRNRPKQRNFVMPMCAPENPVTQAHERALHLNQSIRNLLVDWKTAPGVPEVQKRVQALGPAGQEMEQNVLRAMDLDSLGDAQVSITSLAGAIRSIYGAEQEMENLFVLRERLRHLLTLTYGLEQLIMKSIEAKPNSPIC
jgi:hypothetical protein